MALLKPKKEGLEETAFREFTDKFKVSADQRSIPASSTLPLKPANQPKVSLISYKNPLTLKKLSVCQNLTVRSIDTQLKTAQQTTLDNFFLKRKSPDNYLSEEESLKKPEANLNPTKQDAKGQSLGQTHKKTENNTSFHIFSKKLKQQEKSIDKAVPIQVLQYQSKGKCAPQIIIIDPQSQESLHKIRKLNQDAPSLQVIIPKAPVSNLEQESSQLSDYDFSEQSQMSSDDDKQQRGQNQNSRKSLISQNKFKQENGRDKSQQPLAPFAHEQNPSSMSFSIQPRIAYNLRQRKKLKKSRHKYEQMQNKDVESQESCQLIEEANFSGTDIQNVRRAVRLSQGTGSAQVELIDGKIYYSIICNEKGDRIKMSKETIISINQKWLANFYNQYV